jgi:hypothetical protein
MKQSAAHAPVPLHTPSTPQLVPAGSLLHIVVDELGAQTWQAFAGFTAPDA